MADGSQSDRLAAIMQAFADSLPEKISQIEEQWKQVKISGYDDSLVKLRDLCHGLAGSAATFDFSRIGDCARGIERILRTYLEKRDGEVPLDIGFIDREIGVLRKLLTNRG